MSGLGIDWRLLLVQTINFLILFALLRKWVYPVLIKFLEERAKRIEESLAASEKMRRELKDFEAEKERERQRLIQEAQNIINQSREEGQVEREKIVAEAKERAEEIISLARSQILKEKKEALDSAQKEAAELAVVLARKILSSIDEKQARQLIDQSLRESDTKPYVKS